MSFNLVICVMHTGMQTKLCERQIKHLDSTTKGKYYWRQQSMTTNHCKLFCMLHVWSTYNFFYTKINHNFVFHDYIPLFPLPIKIKLTSA